MIVRWTKAVMRGNALMILKQFLNTLKLILAKLLNIKHKFFKKLITPGENGTHLIKLKLPTCKYLKNWSEKQFWHRVKKGFLFVIYTKKY